MPLLPLSVVFAAISLSPLGFTAPATGPQPTAPAASQCVDPPPSGDFLEHTDQIVTFTDNYRTFMDVRVPSVAPGPCGWPLVVLVHPTGGSRDSVNIKAQVLAMRGFATVTYDVRGQGPGMSLNDPRFFGREILGMRERLDMFEIMEETERLFADLIDFDRIGVTGRSQGGLLSFLAAAHSGKTFPPNPWRTAPAPVIRAVAPVNIGPGFLEAMIPGYQTFSEMQCRQLYEDEATSGLHLNPVIFTFIEPYLANKDFIGMATAMYNPALDPVLLLQDSSVPIMAQLVWDDKFAPINRMITDWDSLLVPGTRKFLNHSTTGHTTAVNYTERLSTEYRRIIFFEEELKGIDRGLDEWKEYRFAVTPIPSDQYNDLNRVWDVIESDVFPLEGTQTETLYFASNHALQEAAPAQSDYYLLEHETNNIKMDDYFDHLPEPEVLQLGMPMNSIQFISQPLDEGVLMLGTPKITLNVGSLETSFQVAVSLHDHASGRYLGGGFKTIRDNTPMQELEIEMELSMGAFYLPKGTVIRTQINNLAWHHPPTSLTYLHALPIFEDFKVAIRVGGTNATKLELPILQMDRPILSYSEPFAARYGNNDGKFALRSYDHRTAGWNYQIVASYSGTSPGVSYLGIHVPINPDKLTQVILDAPLTLPIQNFDGQLNANSEAEAKAFLSQLPVLPFLVQHLDFCAIMVSPGGTEAQISNVVHLEVN